MSGPAFSTTPAGCWTWRGRGRGRGAVSHSQQRMMHRSSNVRAVGKSSLHSSRQNPSSSACLPVISRLHDPGNVQQTSSKCIQNTRANCSTFAGSCKRGMTDFGKHLVGWRHFASAVVDVVAFPTHNTTLRTSPSACIRPSVFFCLSPSLPLCIQHCICSRVCKVSKREATSIRNW